MNLWFPSERLFSIKRKKVFLTVWLKRQLKAIITFSFCYHIHWMRLSAALRSCFEENTRKEMSQHFKHTFLTFFFCWQEVASFENEGWENEERERERWEDEEEGKKEEKERNEGERTEKSAIQDSLAILGFCFKGKIFTKGRERNKGEKEERKK